MTSADDTDTSDVLYRPSHPQSTQTEQFRAHLNTKLSLDLRSYAYLHKWSVTHRGQFWSEVWDWEGVVGEKGDGPYVDETARPRDNPAWFPSARLNWAENQLRNFKTHPDDIAIIDFSESCPGYDPEPTRLTQRELYSLVARAQSGMVAAGLKKGHRVAYWGGNRLEAVVVLLATSAIGAIFSSVAADFGVGGVIERLEQIKPKLLFVSNGVVYNGQPRPLLPLVASLFQSLSAVPDHTVLITHVPPHLSPDLSPSLLSSVTATKVTPWTDFLSAAGDREAVVTFERMGFNEPIWILFSSGTTGRPKAIVHRQGGMLIDSLREHHLAGDISRGDVYFYYTTPGWMMFQYLVSGLATGATIVMYEGSPLKRPQMLWEKVDELGITVFGTSAKYIEQLSKVYPDVGASHSLSTLRQILTTGSPLPPQLFDYVYAKIKRDVLLGSVTGGTDICSVFAGRNTSLPVIRGEIQSIMLGFALDTDTPGTGELICREAFPIEPVGFWPVGRASLPDADKFSPEEEAKAQERFLDSYFKDSAGTWYHGDHVRITPSRFGNGGGVVMLGRSDGVLNPSGIRFGPADIYSVIESPAFVAKGVDEALVVGLVVDAGADEKVVLFVKMSNGVELDEVLVKNIKTAIRTARSARHVPSKIVQVTDVPVTLTGKKIEVQIRKVINGGSVSAINPDTLRNPECLAEYVALGGQMRREEGIDA